MIEGQEDVTWDDWVAIARACESSGVGTLFRSDHYYSVLDRAERGSLDALVDTLMKLQNVALWADTRIRAIDVNPLVIGEAGIVAVDALVVPATAEAEAPATEAVA